MTTIGNIQGTTTAAKAPEQRDPKLWSAAQQFESVLVEQLTTQLQQTAQPDDDSSGGADGDTPQPARASASAPTRSTSRTCSRCTRRRTPRPPARRAPS